MISHGDHGVAPPRPAAAELKSFERLWASDFVDEVPIDVEKSFAVIGLVDQMALSELVEEGQRCGHANATHGISSTEPMA